MKKQKVNFWKHKSKEPKLVKQSSDLVKTGVGVVLGLTLLGAGLQAFKNVTSNN